MIGKTFAHYEIIDLLGKGGMGEVYRARDRKLDREVALKILPDVFGRDPERVARFQREARTLASLNHNNIAAIYGFEQEQDTRFLVIELVEGLDLSQKLAKGALPLEEALHIARQIADGLEEAHEQGVVHRDLKPANVKITPDGKVKILDFGLARAFQGETVDEGELHNSPTITAAMTQAGVILGTAAYMSPEQARGKIVDRRADLWSFGVILWEMLTGVRLFEGEDVSDTLASVLRSDPDWDQLPESTPPAVRRLLERCLVRDPRQRLRDIGEARIRLEQWTSDPSSMMDVVDLPASEEISGNRSRLPWALVVLASALAAWGWLSQLGGQTAESPQSRLKLDLRLENEDSIPQIGGANVQLAPDGTQIAYRHAGGLSLRRLDDRETRHLSGTEGAAQFTFSPDGQWIAFTANGRLYRVSTTGGGSIDICAAPDSRGVAWVNEGTIVLSPHYTDGLVKVSLDNGQVEPLTNLDGGAGERTHRWPAALPDGQSILYLCQFQQQEYDEGEIRQLSLADGTTTAVYRGGSFPMYATSGHLLFARDQSIFAIQFDPDLRKTSGLAIPVLTGVMANVNDQDAEDGSAQFHVARDGTALYRMSEYRPLTLRKLIELDIASGERRELTEPATYYQRVVSPDGQKVALSRGLDDRDIYLLDLQSGVESRFTFTEGADQLGCFSADSRELYWVRTTGMGADHVLRRAVDGSTPEELLLSTEVNVAPTSATPDGKFLALDVWGDAEEWNSMLLPLDVADPELRPFLSEPDNEVWTTFSPDGRFFSYFSDKTVDYVLYVGRFPDTGARWAIDGIGPTVDTLDWSADGRHLYFRNLRGVGRIPYTVRGESFVAGRFESLMELNMVGGSMETQAAFDRTGQRFYMFSSEADLQGEDSMEAIVLDTGWLDELRRRTSGVR